MKKLTVLGISGREGAGKTTIANLLTGSAGPQYQLVKITDPMSYMIFVIFGVDYNNVRTLSKNYKDPVWNYNIGRMRQLLTHMVCQYVDSNWFNNHPEGDEYEVPFDVMTGDSDRWTEFSLATALKKICSLIFGISYKVLLAQTPEDRELREQIKSPKFSCCGAVTGRYCLEYFGTDVMRNNWDNLVWVKIMQRDATNVINQGGRVVIPDIRFVNEFHTIGELGGKLMVVYQSDGDLVLTEQDQKTHPAKWHFLKFAKDANNIMLRNPMNMSTLRDKLCELGLLK